ncbi:MAG: hypothetical protein WKH64_03305 [Chloroflexia bacterium]
MKIFLRFVALVVAVVVLGYGLFASSVEIVTGSGPIDYTSDRIWILALFVSTLPMGYILFSLIPRQAVGWRRNTGKIVAILVLGYIVLACRCCDSSS